MYTNNGKTLQKVIYNNYDQLKSLCKNNACCYFRKDLDIKVFTKNTIGFIIKCIHLDAGKNVDFIKDKVIEAIEAGFRETIVPTKRIE